MDFSINSYLNTSFKGLSSVRFMVVVHLEAGEPPKNWRTFHIMGSIWVTTGPLK